MSKIESITDGLGKNYEQWNVTWPKLRDENAPGKKYHYIPLGVAFMRSGKIDVRLDTIPINWDGRMVLWPSK